MSAHTPGRLKVADDGSLGSIVSTDGEAVGHTFQVSAADQLAGSPIRKARARRLVAAWNACDGYDTEALESEDLMTLFQCRTISKLMDAKTQRDELLAALKLAHKELTRAKNVMLSETGNGVVDMNVLWKTEKAIQKVEGE
jgi:hypothetical protein